MKLKSWKEIPIGGIIEEAGNSGDKEKGYKTGDWRVQRPMLHINKCTNCMICYIYCPDTSVVIDKEKAVMKGFDLNFCKGCGVCAAVCPVKCIDMKNEKDFTDCTTCVVYDDDKKEKK